MRKNCFSGGLLRRTWPAETVRIWDWAVYPGRGDGGVRGGQARAGEEGGPARTCRFEKINIFFSKVWMEFIYGIVGGAGLLVGNVLEIV